MEEAGGVPYPVGLDDLLKLTVENKASDLHLVAGARPSIRLIGEIAPQDYPILSPSDLEGLLYGILSPEQKDRLKSNLELDFSYSIPGVARFRGSIMVQRGSLAAVFRAVPYVIPEFHRLGLPQEIRKLCGLSRGLVLVTGPTGSGKSTTLAAIIDILNSERRLNIVTIEDPIEFLHRHKLSTVRQREIGTDTHSFENALRHVLRHDPDVILIGEMRDLESISIALTAAETGHLVFSTLHTQTAPLTISRIVDVFQSERREQVRQQLANSFRAVISQQLVPMADGSGRVVAVEYMVDTPAIRSLIREGKEHQLYSAIQTGQALGMQTMDSALSRLHGAGIITRETALDYCIDRVEMERLLRSAGFAYKSGW
jgi:twitching motility protein PilT